MNDSHSIKKNIVLFLFMSIFLIKGIFYAVYITPPVVGTAPDDTGHLSYIQYIASERRLPILNETPLESVTLKCHQYYNDRSSSGYENFLVTKEEFDKRSDGNWIAQHPPLYYLIMTPVYLITKLFTNQLSIIIIVLRIITITFGLLFICTISKIMDLLQSKKIVQYCILSSIVFSMPIQYYFSNITNDSLLIYLCALSLYFLLKYRIKKQEKSYFHFVICCALICITKYTGALVIITYIAYFLWFSLKENRIKKTLKLSLQGIFLGGMIVFPVFMRNFILYGNPLAVAQVGNDTFNMSFTQFIIDKNYLDILYQACVTFVGMRDFIVADKQIKWVFAFILASLAFLCIIKVKNKYVRLFTFYSCYISAYVFLYHLNVEFNTMISLFSILIIGLYMIASNIIDLKKKEINLFFFLVVLVVFLIFMFMHYNIALNNGFARAVHGRYYYIAIFPFLYLIFNILEEYKFKYTKYLPILITSTINEQK